MNLDRSLAMIGLPPSYDTASSPEDIFQLYASKMVEFDADWLDTEANEYWRQAGTVCLPEDEFHASAQGKAIQNDGLYLVQPSDVGILGPVPYPNVQDASRRLLTSQPDMRPVLVEGNLGKRDVSLDLKSEKGRQTLRQLILDADIVLDGYRPGALERLGFGESYILTLARRRGRGIIVVRENCYRWHGPMASRSCWQQISDCFTGVSWGMGEFLGLKEPIVPPLPNSDYQTGIVGLLGVLAAVDKRANEGGSYTVDVSLNQTNQFLLSLGKLPPEVQASLRALHPDFAPRRSDDMGALITKYLQTACTNTPTLFKPRYFNQRESNYGRADGKLEMLRFVTSPTNLDVTALGYDVGSCFHGAYAPEWPVQSA
ncbi:caib baif family enzyme [Bipolaris maydis]|nr:caib baif family enzyme [Bipolaris maydis]